MPLPLDFFDDQKQSPKTEPTPAANKEIVTEIVDDPAIGEVVAAME